MTTPRQLSFDLPSVAVAGLDDFFVAPSNADAFARVEAWRKWPENKLIIIGPRGSGKSHLCAVWADLSGAEFVGRDGLRNLSEARDGQGFIIDDCHRIAGDAGAEEALFHLFNRTAAHGQPVLMTAPEPPSRWGVSLPDLASRLALLDVVKLSQPDDALLATIIGKLFLDRQLNVKPEVVTFIVRRMDRSFAAATRCVEALDRAALTEGKTITIPFVKDVLGH